MDHPDGPVAHGEGDEDQGDSLAGKFFAELQFVPLLIRTAIQVFSSFNLNLEQNFMNIFFLKFVVCSQSHSLTPGPWD